MVQAMRSDLLRGQRMLGGDVRQSRVLIRLAEPVPRGMVWEFLRIRLTPEMLAGGEERAYQVALTQPHRANFARRCPRCRVATRQVAETTWRCPSCHRLVDGTPLRGVVRLEIPSDAVDADGMVSQVILCLDRRYSRRVLDAVYRTAGVLCESLGWRVL